MTKIIKHPNPKRTKMLDKPHCWISMERTRILTRVNLVDIVYVESDRDRATFHLVNGQELSTLRPMHRIVKCLNRYSDETPFRFVQVNSGFTLNLRYLEYVEETTAYLIAGDRQACEKFSQTYWAIFREAIRSRTFFRGTVTSAK